MNSKFLFNAFALLLIFSQITCNRPVQTGLTHPEWTCQGNIYEVNVRQYTPEGTFRAFEQHLDRLKSMGVEILWFMPVTPIGLKERKMSEADLGSYYAVKDYKAINPEFGTLENFRSLVKKAHQMGFRIIIDWVANHTAADNEWTIRHPDFYLKDSAGGFISPYDWTDVLKLDYSNNELKDSMTTAMKWWIEDIGVDGFRCDVAEDVGRDFWEYCIHRLRERKDLFMLAEGHAPWLHEVGFDATYQWDCMRFMENLYKGKITLSEFKKLLNDEITKFPKGVQRMYFTTNHDENSWNGTEIEKYGDAASAFAVLTQTMYQSIPLIYSGQESANKKRLRFFTKDTIEWNQYELSGFYEKLLTLRRRNPALSTDAEWKMLKTDKDDHVLAYERSKGKNKVIVVINFSGDKSNYRLLDKSVSATGTELFENRKIELSEEFRDELPPYGFRVIELQ